MANKLFAFDEKLNIYRDEIENQVLDNFPTVIKAKQDGLLFSEEKYTIFSIYLAALAKEFFR